METETLLTWAVVMVGAVAQALTGFGFALVSVPILMLFQDARSVIVTTLLLGTLLNGLILLQTRGKVTLRDAGPVTLGTLLGVPFGSYLLVALSAETLKLMVAALVLLFSIPLLVGYSRRFGHPRALSLLAGAVSGALQGSTSMGGPPVALLMASQGTPKETFRGTMVLRSAAASTLSIVALMPSGLVDASVALHALLLAPALLAGLVVGSLLVRMVPQPLFRQLTVLLVAGTALVSLAGALL